MQNGPSLVQTGRESRYVRARYCLCPLDISSRASDRYCIRTTLAQVHKGCEDASLHHLCRPRSSGSSVEVLMTLVRWPLRSEEHTSELQSQSNLVCRLLLEKKKTTTTHWQIWSQTSSPTI